MNNNTNHFYSKWLTNDEYIKNTVALTLWQLCSDKHHSHVSWKCQNGFWLYSWFLNPLMDSSMKRLCFSMVMRTWNQISHNYNKTHSIVGLIAAGWSSCVACFYFKWQSANYEHCLTNRSCCLIWIGCTLEMITHIQQEQHLKNMPYSNWV